MATKSVGGWLNYARGIPCLWRGWIRLEDLPAQLPPNCCECLAPTSSFWQLRTRHRILEIPMCMRCQARHRFDERVCLAAWLLLTASSVAAAWWIQHGVVTLAKLLCALAVFACAGTVSPLIYLFSLRPIRTIEFRPCRPMLRFRNLEYLHMTFAYQDELRAESRAQALRLAQRIAGQSPPEKRKGTIPPS